jgi:D-alanyl-D-alanine dipeptidase
MCLCRLQYSITVILAVGALTTTGCLAGSGKSVRKSTSANVSSQTPNVALPPPELELGPTELNLKSAGLVEVSDVVPGVGVELVYATANNFANKPLYGDLRRCYLRSEVAAKVGAAVKVIQERAPGISLVLRDCARPRSVQARMWEAVVGSDFEPLVANPYGSASSHNFGVGVDATLAKEGRELDFGSQIDDTTETATGKNELEDALQARGKLTARQIANRRLLREAMVASGFHGVDSEWWHFNAYDKRQFSERYSILE